MDPENQTNPPTDAKDESTMTDSPDKSSAPLTIDIEYADRVNFAMQQNGVPLVEQVTILNEGDVAASDVVITLALENDACERWTRRFEAIPPGEAIRFESEANEFRLRARELAQRTEAERTVIACSVESGLGARVTRSFPIDLLAFDHWQGIGYYPELLAAFVTPNHPSIADLLQSARASLSHLSEHDAIDGYQSGSRQRAALIAEAGFNALAARGIGYIGVPASFEKQGQRVRLVDRVVRESFGNCLDLSLVLAGLWEQSGLHALVLFTEGHAMPAVWTHASHLPEPAIDEPARIRNLVELGEIVPVEATTLTKSGTSFAKAVEAARKTLANPGATFCAVDIRCSRKRGVRPLPLRDDRDATALDLDAIDTTPAPVTAGTRLDSVALADRIERDIGVATPAESEESGDDRIRRWQKRLLDLSLRNRLINFRETKSTIRLNVPDVARVEDLLADEARLTINPRADGDDQFLREQLDAKHVSTAESSTATAERLLKIYRTARLSVEETGANLLHIALGMLKWYESPTSEQPRFAPLILLPVRLYRHATGSGYRYDFSLTDEPLRPNITLLEKLHTEFGIDTSGLEDLPEDENGIDVPLILHRFRRAIRDTRWEVDETAHLGLFSFNKFLMWRDLREHLDQLRQNRLVRHLIDREHGEFDAQPFPQADSLDDDVPPGELLCTRDADSTQLAAIRAASTSRTFVLEGPPGTGKSQTIANIIADSLGRGKRVLFVAEKMAALTVVSKRLHDDGLGPFCLELHSAKASKKEVLIQLQAALDAATPTGLTDWDALCAELGIARGKLNTYVRELHQPRASGESLYQVLARLSRLGDGPRVQPPTNTIAQTTPEELAAWRSAIDAMIDASEAINIPHEHDLRGIGRSEWSFTLTEEVKECLSIGLDAIGELEHCAQELLLQIGKATGSFHGDARKFGRDSVQALAVLASMLLESPAPDVRLIDGKEAPAIIADLRALIEQGKRRDRLRDELALRYRPEFLDLDHLVHLDAVNRASKRPAILKPIFAFLARRSFRPYCTADVPTLDELSVDLDTAREAKQLTSTLAAANEPAQIFGRRWKSGEANWAELEECLTWCERYRKTAEVLKREKDGAALFKSLAQVAGEDAPPQSLAESARDLVKAWKEWTTAWTAIKETLVTNSEMAFGDGVKRDWAARVEESFNRWSFANPQLNDWCVWRRARDAAAALNLTDLITRYERGELARGQLRDTFERSYGEKWFNAVANSVEAIRTFNTGSHQKTIERFRALDKALIQHTRDTITARLRERMPAINSQVSGQSELGILRRELEKKSRHLPTRRLIGAMPNLLPRLKPCFLMSPLSVAQFLDAGLPPFDLVVFDEASQIPVWDSIGAIARGTEVIVVGDSKQLPPTTFFNTLDGEDESTDEDIAIEDMESILKECNASGIPALWLKWHYRSRHETLISFSNHHYYRNELHTFPSPVDRSAELGVSFRYVEDGVYDRGGSRTNRVEAERVVNELVRLLTEPETLDSIGIVTFNQAQQSLIEDLLDAKRRDVPAIDRYFTPEVDEPVFVKNLENVQGDERDTIIFSVGYGPDANGRFSMNFGPLNQDGGERRLNVAITRARKRLAVFSSLRPDHIDLKRTRALGVRHFKAFLDYAERGPRALAESVAYDGARAFDAGFERTIFDALTARGWDVDMQVGCAGYRIDLAVRDPKTPGRYLLGIECDGAAYHSAKTARDRDRLREAVLRNLGWNIERIWSTDWRINPDRALRSIEQRLAQLTSSSEDVAPVPVDPPAVAVAVDDEPTRINSAHVSTAEATTATPPPHVMHPTYRRARPKHSQIETIDLFDSRSANAGTRAIEAIVRAEGPIVDELALRRLAEWFGIGRITDRYRSRFDELLSHVLRSGLVIRNGDALWPADLAPGDFRDFRTPGPDDADQRDLEHIPLIERMNAVVHTVHQQFGLPREELEREAAKALGLSRATARVKELMSEAIDSAVDRGLVQSAGERITVP